MANGIYLDKIVREVTCLGWDPGIPDHKEKFERYHPILGPQAFLARHCFPKNFMPMLIIRNEGGIDSRYSIIKRIIPKDGHYEIQIKENAFFNDGSMITVDDVMSSLRCWHHKMGLDVQVIREIKNEDDAEFIVKSKLPIQEIGLQSCIVFKQDPASSSAYVGNGCFMLKKEDRNIEILREKAHNEGITYIPNPYQDGQLQIDGFNVRIMQLDEITYALLNGNADVAFHHILDIPGSIIEGIHGYQILQGSDPEYSSVRVVINKNRVREYVLLPRRGGKLDDKKNLYKTIDGTISRGQLKKDLGGEHCQSWVRNNDYLLWRFSNSDFLEGKDKYSIEIVPESTEVKIWYYDLDGGSDRIFESLKKQLSRIGITLTKSSIEDADASLVPTPFRSPIFLRKMLYKTDGTRNEYGYQVDEVDAWFERGDLKDLATLAAATAGTFIQLVGGRDGHSFNRHNLAFNDYGSLINLRVPYLFHEMRKLK